MNSESEHASQRSPRGRRGRQLTTLLARLVFGGLACSVFWLAFCYVVLRPNAIATAWSTVWHSSESSDPDRDFLLLAFPKKVPHESDASGVPDRAVLVEFEQWKNDSHITLGRENSGFVVSVNHYTLIPDSRTTQLVDNLEIALHDLGGAYQWHNIDWKTSAVIAENTPCTLEITSASGRRQRFAYFVTNDKVIPERIEVFIAQQAAVTVAIWALVGLAAVWIIAILIIFLYALA